MKRLVFNMLLLALLLSNSYSLWAQPAPGVYLGGDPENQTQIHEVKVSENYLIHSEYYNGRVIGKFVSTIGGFYTADKDSLHVKLEFNSNYANDSLRTKKYAYQMYGDTLILNENKIMVLNPVQAKEQDLDGTWLFATRGPDTGQERRGDESARKTLKFLKDGYFQWIAYNTETMRFSGTGGGMYTAKDGKYSEIIQYFSRDNSRVGAVLDFNYEISRADWHHTGKNSKGEPMYEIWARRE